MQHNCRHQPGVYIPQTRQNLLCNLPWVNYRLNRCIGGKTFRRESFSDALHIPSNLTYFRPHGSLASIPDTFVMALDRSGGRNVHIYATDDPTQTVLGGLVLTNGVTNNNFYSMIEIFLVFRSTFSLQDIDGVTIDRNDHPLQPGKYYVTGEFTLFYSTTSTERYIGSFSINNEPLLTRALSLSTGTRHESFRSAVRARDGRCVITGQVALSAHLNGWVGFKAAHVFPLAYEGYWDDQNYNRWITRPPATGMPINSVQNGLLLRADIHELFDSYFFSINPDVCITSIVYFTELC